MLRYKFGSVYLKYVFGCHDIVILYKRPMKWRQRLDMNIALDWDVKHKYKHLTAVSGVGSSPALVTSV